MLTVILVPRHGPSLSVIRVNPTAASRDCQNVFFIFFRMCTALCYKGFKQVYKIPENEKLEVGFNGDVDL